MRGLTLAELLLSLALLAVAAALLVPPVTRARRADNERGASASLKTITTAEADFRSNDRDGNGVNDFWTADVYALYGLVPQPDAPAIRLIERDVALADGLPLTHLYSHLQASRRGPRRGYIYRAFASEDSGDGATSLRNDTDGPGLYGACHDRGRFAFMAAPEALSTGRLLFIVNADNSIRKYNLPSTYRGIGGTGHPLLNDAATYPASPGAIGCSHC